VLSAWFYRIEAFAPFHNHSRSTRGRAPLHPRTRSETGQRPLPDARQRRFESFDLIEQIWHHCADAYLRIDRNYLLATVGVCATVLAARDIALDHREQFPASVF
jgi:hypothetical protein